ncbi:hypothetical protein NQ318_020588 [Aromia moschata]|uniref:CCAAT-binding factor domain-containing protein n=1 Tax=Aromia moschata TaxID=1265417 RepID=A0AAV8Z204_9CUCU|nr:hypothetical protein NQ318_020588 [Aromia moschata]
MYKLVHLANFNISLQALSLLYQVSDFANNVTDRFYSALYRKLSDTKLLTTTHQAMLLSLVYKALLKDKEVNRVKMFIKRLLQISLFTQPCFSCGILYLVSQLIGKKGQVQALVLKQVSMNGLEDDEGEERYHDVKEEIVDVDDWESKEIKQEIEDVEVKVEDTKDGEKQPLIIPGQIEIKDEEEDIKPDVEVLESSVNGSAGWYHCRNAVKKEKAPLNKYNPLARNPLYGGGEFCAYTELCKLKCHFHPTVSLYATNIANGETVKYSGDPLKDFTLIRFLDRFVFKNPKRVENKMGVDPTFGRRKLYRPRGVKLMSVNSAGYLKETEKNIPEDELFVYSYLQKKYQYKKTDEEDDSDLESVQSEEFEEMLDKISGFKNVDEIDYMDEIGNSLKKKDKKKSNKNHEEGGDEDENDFSGDENIEDEDFDEEFGEEDFNDDLDLDDEDKDLVDGLDDDEEEDIEFLEDEEPDKPRKNKFKKERQRPVICVRVC